MARLTVLVTATLAAVAALSHHVAANTNGQPATERDGIWQQMTPKGDIPAGRLWHSGAASGSRLFIAGGNSADHFTPYALDTQSMTWEALTPLAETIKAADVSTEGGRLITFGGKTDEYVNTMTLTRIPTDQTHEITIDDTAAPPPRDAHTLTCLAGLCMVFGGWDETAYMNDLWGIDATSLDQAAATGSQVSWTQLIADGAAGSPPARNSHSMTAYGGRMILFGGFSHDVGHSGPWVQCEAADKCHFYNDVWSINMPTGVTLQPLDASEWTQLRPDTAQGNPEGRYGHSATALGDSIYVFAGRTQTTVLNDMWELNLAVNEWVPRNPAGALPPIRYSQVAAAIGTSMYIFSGSNEKSDVWRYTPATLKSVEASEGLGDSGGTGTTVEPVSLGGVNAGLVITILIGIGNLVLLFLVFRKQAQTPPGYSDASL